MTQTQETKDYQQMLESVACNHCGKDDYTVIYPPRYDMAKPSQIDQAFRSSGDEILFDQMVVCNHCGLKYLNPRLNQDVIINGYSSGSDEQFVSQAPARERTFARCLRGIERYCSTKGRVLDIGTAGGSFLHVAKKNGWEVAGCEPNRWLTEWSARHYGLSIFPGTVFAMPLKENFFDVVTLWDVLEHTPDPKKVLCEAYRVLKPGGLLVVNYPDIESWAAKLMGKKWVFLLTIHLYYFGPRTLRRMLEGIGFRVIKRKPHWQSLELDYILFRMQAYVPVLPGAMRKVTNFFKMGKWQVPYWVGQSLMVARKKTTN